MLNLEKYIGSRAALLFEAIQIDTIDIYLSTLPNPTPSKTIHAL